MDKARMVMSISMDGHVTSLPAFIPSTQTSRDGDTGHSRSGG